MRSGWLWSLFLWVSGACEAHAIFTGTDEFDLDDLDTESRLDSEYFTNRLAFRFRPGEEDRWDARDIGYRVSGGSLGSKAFFTFQEGKVHHELTEDLRFRWDLEQLADLDVERLHHAIEVRHRVPFTERFFAGVRGQVTFEKKDADVGAVLAYEEDRWNYLRLTGTLVDFVFSEKTFEGDEDLESPRNLALEASLTPGAWRFGVEAEWDSPLARVLAGDERRFRHENVWVQASARLRLSEAVEVGALASWEETYRASDPFAASEPQPSPEGSDEDRVDQRFFRHATHGRAFVLVTGNASEPVWEAGVALFYRNTRFANDLAAEESYRLDRVEVDPYVEATLPFLERYAVRASYFLGVVHRDWRYDVESQPNRGRVHVQNKLELEGQVTFADRAVLVVGAGVDLDRFGSSRTFDGGNVRFVLGL